MSMIDEEITRLGNRIKDLKLRIIPSFESRTNSLYARIQTMSNETTRSPAKAKLESEYKSLSGELRKRSDEMIRIRQEMERLEIQKRFSR